MKDATGFDRRVVLVYRTTPEELRLIAAELEDMKAVRINWYHTQFVFVNEKDVNNETVKQIEGGAIIN